MPIYVYGLRRDSGAEGCPRCRETFETAQRMSEEALSVCPGCGAPVERRILPVNLGKAEWTKGPSERRLAQAGFTQYRKSGKGGYEKSFGSGPARLGGV